jgi:ribosomal protein L40E
MEIPGDLMWLVWLLLFSGAAIVFVVATARQYRRHARNTDGLVCRACGQGHPGIARFCRRCGTKL